MSIDLDTLARDAAASSPAPPPLPALQSRVAKRRRRRRAASGALAVPFVLFSVIGVRSVIDGRASTEVIVASPDESSSTTVPVPGSLGEFAWPAPPRDFATRYELNQAFRSEVLGWVPSAMGIDVTDQDRLVGAETLIDGVSGTRLRVVAVESEDGWGFVEIGDQTLGVAEGPLLSYSLVVPDGAVRTTIEARFADGTVRLDEWSDSEPMSATVDSELVSALVTHYDADGSVLAVTGGVYGGVEESALDAAPDLGGEPSQSLVDAARDGIVPEIARLPTDVRLAPRPGTDLVEGSEGTWMISEPLWAVLPTDDCLGDGSGTYRADYVCPYNYAEILLLDADGGIVRAYPFIETEPFSLVATDDAIYCGRGGDGGVPDSMLCRIDRETLEITVRVFQWQGEETAFPPDSDWVPRGWTLDPESGSSVDWQAGVELTEQGLIVGAGDTAVVFDPVTLEPLD